MNNMKNLTEQKANVLIIDDQESYCITTADLIQIYGHATHYVHSLEEGMQYLVEHHEVDIILLDIDLGTEINGIQGIPLLLEKYPYAQVIMLTVHNTLEIGLKCIKNGAFDYLTKPFQVESFLRLVPAALERKRMAYLNSMYFDMLIHDLKHPVQNLMFALDFFYKNSSDQFPAESSEFKTLADYSYWQIQNMIKNILTITQMENLAYTVQNNKLPLKQELENSLGTLVKQIELSGKTFNLDCELGGDFLFETDRNLFFQIINNIIWNAIRFTYDEDRINLSCKVEGDFLRLNITNTGSFIPEKEREKVFDKYVQVKDMTKHKGKNFGLGLTFCKMALQLLGGEIWIEGTERVPETTFCIKLKLK